MRKALQHVLMISFFIFGLTAPAAAAGYYIGLLGGGSFLPEAKASDVDGRVNFNFEGGFDGSVTLGYDLGAEHPQIGKGRVEVEFNKASNDVEDVEFVDSTSAASGSVERTSIMLNTIGEYTTRNGIIIYALLGLGWAEVSLDSVSILATPFVDDSDSSLLAYQAGLGLAWKFSPHFFFDMSYRYYGTTDPDLVKLDSGSLNYEYDAHRFLAGIRLHF